MKDSAIKFVFKVEYQHVVELGLLLAFIYETSWGTPFKRYMIVSVFISPLVEIEV